MKLDIKKLIKNLAVPIAIGAISGFLTKGGVEDFNTNAQKPAFSPPDILFPIVWTILYILMGIVAYIIDTSGYSDNKKRALTLYYVQLGFNFLWSFIFFNMANYLLAFIWIVILLGLIIATTVAFYKINPKAAYLMIPYILWVSFATVLNFSIFLLN
ncbi:MAG: tryptophan-rich sensory protein [Clostridia bacterium]|nr:tryptophan-rich sensory protein [Clostridia bacterium]